MTTFCLRYKLGDIIHVKVPDHGIDRYYKVVAPLDEDEHGNQILTCIQTDQIER